MKSLIFAFFIAMSVSIIMGGAIKAQYSAHSAMLSYSYEKRIKSRGEFNKAEDSGFHYFNEINARAVREFMKSYDDVYDVRWYKSDRRYVASFEKDSVITRLYYNNRGDLEVTLRYYSENRLSPEIRRIVRSKYFDYHIFHVSEAIQNGSITYQIKMQHKTHYRIINITNGEMEEILEYFDAESK